MRARVEKVDVLGWNKSTVGTPNTSFEASVTSGIPTQHIITWTTNAWNMNP